MLNRVSQAVQDWQARQAQDPLRLHDAVTHRAEALSAQMFKVFQATPAGAARDLLNKTDLDLSHLRWAYLAVRLPPATFSAYMDELAALVASGIPDAAAEQEWANRAEDSTATAVAASLPQVDPARLPWTAAPAGDERKQDQESANLKAQAERLLQSRSFDQLDALATRLRVEERRLPGGGLALQAVYARLARFVMTPEDRDDPAGGADYRSRRALIQEWLSARPRSTTAHLAMAILLRQHAWSMRGGDYASAVDARHFAAFQNQLLQARQVLEQIDARADPVYFTTALVLELEIERRRGEPKQLFEIFKSATRAFPRAYEIYASYARCLEEGWDGRPGELQAFMHSLQNEPGGEAGWLAYAFVAGYQAEEFNRAGFPAGTGLEPGALKHAIEVRERTFGLNGRQWNGVVALGLAFRDQALARQGLAHVRAWEPALWQNKQLFAAVVSWANGGLPAPDERACPGCAAPGQLPSRSGSTL
ncbi:MAG: DUF4034 domain-containing protein [Pseudomonadota bacterium]|nr:DUF4034 domain-containing protein [Pseudomonadota bacterium]